MRLAYVDLMRWPNVRAHGIAITGMCNGYRAHGVEVDRYHPMRTHWTGRSPWWFNKWYRAVYAARLCMRARKGGYDFYHTRSTQCLPWLPRSKTIVEIHLIPGRLWFEWESFRVVITTTDVVLRKLHNPSNGMVLSSGVDVRDFENVDVIENDRWTIGYVGSVSSCGQDKGVGVIREAVGGMKGVEFKVISNFPRPLAIRHMCGCDVLVVPPSNVRWQDGSPIKLFEYMASGVAVVAARMEGTKVVEHVLKVDPTVEGLRCGIATALKSPNHMKWMAERAKEEVREYTWEKRAGRVLDYLGAH